MKKRVLLSFDLMSSFTVTESSHSSVQPWIYPSIPRGKTYKHKTLSNSMRKLRRNPATLERHK
jgi:hypothetical protein